MGKTGMKVNGCGIPLYWQGRKGSIPYDKQIVYNDMWLVVISTVATILSVIIGRHDACASSSWCETGQHAMGHKGRMATI